MEDARIQSTDVVATEELWGPHLALHKPVLLFFFVLPLDQHLFICLILFVICCRVLELSFCDSLVGPVVWPLCYTLPLLLSSHSHNPSLHLQMAEMVWDVILYTADQVEVLQSPKKKRPKVKELGVSVLNRHVNFVHRTFTQSNGADS